MTTENRRTFSAVPITLLTSPGSTSQFEVYPPTVEVDVTGPINDLKKLQIQEISAFVDVTGVTDSRAGLADHPGQVGRDLKADSINPTEARVQKTTAPKPAP